MPRLRSSTLTSAVLGMADDRGEAARGGNVKREQTVSTVNKDGGVAHEQSAVPTKRQVVAGNSQSQLA